MIMLTAALTFSAVAKDEFVVRMVAPLQFAEENVGPLLKRSDVERLRDLNVYDFEFTERGEQYSIRTCRQFERVDPGMFFTSYRANVASLFFRVCGILRAVTKAERPEKTYVSNPVAPISNPKLLSVTLLPAMTSQERDKLDNHAAVGRSMWDVIATKKAKVTKLTPIALEVAYDLMRVSITEIARADFDGDGVEDILVNVVHEAVPGHGDYVDSSLYLFTRLHRHGLFRGKPFH